MRNLYIVSTPIGNLQDISLRAAKTLLSSQTIIAESTSKSGLLLSFLEKEFNSKRSENQKVISLTEDEEELKLASIIKLLEGSDAALISEAGTPLVSDPGYKLVREAIKRGVNIISIPGPVAAITALTSSGLPSDKFLFLGFLPKSEAKKEKVFQNLKSLDLKATAIIYESPQRLVETLVIIEKVFGDLDIVLARELTKIHEEIKRDKVSDILRFYKDNNPKGEFVILF